MRFVTIRWLLAIVCMLVCIQQMAVGLKIEGLGAAGHIIASLAAGLVSVILVAPEIISRLAELISRPFANLLFPSEQLSKPPLSYRLARYYREEMRLDESIGEYASIIEFYPDEKDAYVELIDLAKATSNDELQQQYADLFRKRFGTEPPAPKPREVSSS